MTTERALQLMKIERQCVQRQSIPFACDRECENCDIVQDDRELIAAYDCVIRLLDAAIRDK